MVERVKCRQAETRNEDETDRNGMAITREQVEHVALLARLELDPAREEKIIEQLGAILDYIAKLNELDTTNVEPLTHASELHNVFREDKGSPSLPREEALANAPVQAQGCFRVPPVLG